MFRTIIVTALFATASLAQTAAVPSLSVAIPAMSVKLPAVVVPRTPLACAVAKSGTTCVFPQTTLIASSLSSTAAVTVKTAAVSAPVTIPAYAFTITLTPAQAAQLLQALTNGGTADGLTINLAVSK